MMAAMSAAGEDLTERMRCLALVKDPASLAALLTQSCEKLAGPWLGPLTPQIFARILQHAFSAPMTLRARVQAAATLTRVCKAWKPAVEAAAFSLLQFDVDDRAVLAHFDPKHGSHRTALQHVRAVKLEQANSSAAMLASMAAGLLRDLPIRIPDVGGTARRSSPGLRPEQVILIASVLANSPKLEYLDADTAATAVLPDLTAQYKLTSTWPHLRAIAMTWTRDLDDFVALLQKISQVGTLGSVNLSVYPPTASSGGHRRPAGNANARFQALPRLKELSVKASDNVDGLWDAAAKLIPAHAKLAMVQCHGFVPPNLCETLTLRCKSIVTLELDNLRADTDLGKVMLPQIGRLGGTLVRMLRIDIAPCSLFLGAREVMPPASHFLDKLPTSICIVDATCASSGQPASFTYDDRLAAILARPASHALELDNAGHLVPAPGEKQPLQIVYLNADGHPPTRYAFVRFGNERDYTEWSHVDIPRTGQQWKM